MSRVVLIALALVANAAVVGAQSVVFQTDFATADGAVAAMKGVAAGVGPDLHLVDLTHQIPPFDIWQAAWRLNDVVPYWPQGTVFVSVVDPGVGTGRRSVVIATGSGHYVVSPDNGTLTLVAEHQGVEAVREIDVAAHRLPGSEASHTFHGRDVFAVVGAKLAAGKMSFEDVGPSVQDVLRIPYEKSRFENGKVFGIIPVLDPNFGNVWTNIGGSDFHKLGLVHGDTVHVSILLVGDNPVDMMLPFVSTFGDVSPGSPLLYLNSHGNVAFAINQGSFARARGIRSGPDWRVVLRRP